MCVYIHAGVGAGVWCVHVCFILACTARRNGTKEGRQDSFLFLRISIISLKHQQQSAWFPGLVCRGTTHLAGTYKRAHMCLASRVRAGRVGYLQHIQLLQRATRPQRGVKEREGNHPHVDLKDPVYALASKNNRALTGVLQSWYA